MVEERPRHLLGGGPGRRGISVRVLELVGAPDEPVPRVAPPHDRPFVDGLHLADAAVLAALALHVVLRADVHDARAKRCIETQRALVVRDPQASHAAFGAARIRAMPHLSRKSLVVDERAVRHEVNQGPNSAWQQGFETAGAHQARCMDPNGAEDVVDDQVAALWGHELGFAAVRPEQHGPERRQRDEK